MEGMPSRFAAAAVLVGALVGVAAAVPSGQPAALEALALCRAAERLEGAARRESLERGLVLARAAVAADERDAAAHFATFCALGRLVQLRGLDPWHPFEALRALDELEAAVRLAPEDPDVLAAKGATLLRLPRLLGGDPGEGRTWLRRALARDPHHCAAGAYLAAAEAPRDDETLRLPDGC
jgi:cytochrome c-type biogenesis protein CcmH/NrfG